MSFKWFRKNEQGSVMVIAAIALTALLGVSGLAVDYGSMALTRQELQNAADAAALAAGQDKLYGAGNYVDTANAYIAANGIDLSDGVTVSQVTSTSQGVRVTITTQKRVGFSSVLTGRNTEEVSATALAQVMNEVQNYPYALFAGDTVDDGGTGVTGTGNGMVIEGNVHSNTNVSLKHAIVTGAVTAYGDIEYSGRKINNSKDPVIPMPNMLDIVTFVKNNGAYFDGDVYIKQNQGGFQEFIRQAIEEKGGSVGSSGLNIYINGSLTIRGDEFYNNTYPLNLVVKNGINLGGTPIRSEAHTPVVLVSEKGSIEVNGQGTTGGGFYGLVFATNGDVTLNGGNSNKYYGSIYALNITKHGNGLTVTYNSSVGNHLPKGKVRLIE